MMRSCFPCKPNRSKQEIELLRQSYLMTSLHHSPPSVLHSCLGAAVCAGSPPSTTLCELFSFQQRVQWYPESGPRPEKKTCLEFFLAQMKYVHIKWSSLERGVLRRPGQLLFRLGRWVEEVLFHFHGCGIQLPRTKRRIKLGTRMGLVKSVPWTPD